jgi:hypothetical protein
MPFGFAGVRKQASDLWPRKSHFQTCLGLALPALRPVQVSSCTLFHRDLTKFKYNGESLHSTHVIPWCLAA